MSNQPAPVVFELTVRIDPYDPVLNFGTYATHAAAKDAADFILANWEGEDKPSPTNVRIIPKEVFSELPELHLWYCQVSLEDPELKPLVHRLSRPTLEGFPSNDGLLREPLRFISCPLLFVAGSGQTPDIAKHRANERLKSALEGGALELLAWKKRVTEIAEAQHAALPQGQYSESVSWWKLQQIIEQVAKEELVNLKLPKAA